MEVGDESPVLEFPLVSLLTYSFLTYLIDGRRLKTGSGDSKIRYQPNILNRSY